MQLRLGRQLLEGADAYGVIKRDRAANRQRRPENDSGRRLPKCSFRRLASEPYERREREGPEPQGRFRPRNACAQSKERSNSDRESVHQHLGSLRVMRQTSRRAHRGNNALLQTTTRPDPCPRPSSRVSSPSSPIVTLPGSLTPSSCAHSGSQTGESDGPAEMPDMRETRVGTWRARRDLNLRSAKSFE